MRNYLPKVTPIALAAAVLSLGACHGAVLDPAGDIALQERNLIYASTGLMLLIIRPRSNSSSGRRRC
jgi:cytochrome o ubiquinol oxidase subunit 2